MPFRGSMYGLQVQASEPIPGLISALATSPADVQISFGVLPEWLTNDAAPGMSPWYVSADSTASNIPILRIWALKEQGFHRLLYADNTEFVVDATGSRVWCRWPESLSLADTATYLLGPVMGFILLLRGITCLHASAVAVGDRAIAIVGPAEAGKSTTAAAFARLGYAILSDDVVTLDERDGAFFVHPAYARIRLWPESVEALYGSADALPRLTPTWDKRYLDLTEDGYRFQCDPLPLAAIYVLGERASDPAAPRIEGVHGRDGLVPLVAHTY